MTSSDLAAKIASLHAGFDSGKTRSLDWRKAQLNALAQMISQNEDAIFAALKADLGKAPAESFATEVGFVTSEIKYVLKNLGRWMRPTKVSPGIANQPGKASLVPEPLGVVLIMAPWNYPFMLTIGPLIGATMYQFAAPLPLYSSAFVMAILGVYAVMVVARRPVS